jgi:drug/metabolite transporter (DMT)-like permease
MPSQSYLAHVLLILVNLIYGINFSVAKKIMPTYIGPFGFIVYRVAITLVLFAVLYYFNNREKIARSDYIRLFFCGLFGIALNQLLFFKGISMTSSIHGSLLMITSPMITYIISACLGIQIWSKIKLLGIAFGTFGASILIYYSFRSVGSSHWIGDLAVCLNAISFSVYLILVKPLMQKYRPITIAFYCFLAGLPWVLLAGYSQANAVVWQEFPTRFYSHFLFVIIGATFIVYLFNIIAIKSVSATTVSSYIYLQPLFAILVAVFCGGENLDSYAIVGGSFIIFGIWLINHFSKQKSIP